MLHLSTILLTLTGNREPRSQLRGSTATGRAERVSANGYHRNSEPSVLIRSPRDFQKVPLVACAHFRNAVSSRRSPIVYKKETPSDPLLGVASNEVNQRDCWRDWATGCVGG
jgi:hypothetical protein